MGGCNCNQSLLSNHVYEFKGDILIFGTCVPDMAQEIFGKFSEDKQAYSICLEEFHISQFAQKLSTIMSLGNISSVTILTIDGSPHCVQVHTGSEDARKNTKFKGELKHFVVDKEKKLHEITPEQIRTSRYLSEVRKCVGKDCTCD